jgi:NAD(P)-dependent dehydrogenase (short-subunit alcohol dehydrogenase family)
MEFDRSSTAEQIAAHFASRAEKRLFLVTGGYSGIGVETVKALLKSGASVYVAGRDQAKLDTFVEEMKSLAKNGASGSGGHGASVSGGHVLDLADLESVKAFSEHFLAEHSTLDVLINNAGVMNTPASVTKQGLEMQFGTNVVGHFLLTKLLAPAIKKADAGRVVFLSSVGHSIHGAARLDLEYLKNFDVETSEYNGWNAYQQSKLGDLLLAKSFVKYHDIESASVHPGFINTNLNRSSTLWQSICFLFRNLTAVERMKSPEQGAATSILVALTNELELGGYYTDCQLTAPHECATHSDDVDAIYEYCDKVTKQYQ